MRILLTAISCVALSAGAALAAPAPTPAPATPPKTYLSAAEVQALAAAAAQRAQGNPLVAQPMIGLLPYVANLEYRTAVGPAAVHETEAELFYVIDGSGVLVTGGKLTGETRANPENRRGVGVEGGTTRNVGKGDVFIVPEGVPHWFSRINGTLVMMSLHVPHNAGNPR
jgi:mannose-6-phosphate isomerase-like protein (cupin superfamily)